METENSTSTPDAERFKVLANEAFKGILPCLNSPSCLLNGCISAYGLLIFLFVMCFFSANKYSQAIDLYSQAIKVNEGNAVYWANRAFAHTKLEEYGSAIQDATRAIEIDAKYSKVSTVDFGFLFGGNGNLLLSLFSVLK